MGGAQDVCLGVPHIDRFESAGRGHRQRRQHLKQMALEHVAQGARRVVEAGPAFQRHPEQNALVPLKRLGQVVRTAGD
ncbi:hypothetical protein GCM10010261_19710 [Streptomyces pilosus]|nr:hypothetical protein GCM10010261_19710 [Streptomyces pilosus]